MGTKDNKKKKQQVILLLSQEKWNTRYDILHHSLWIIVKCFFLLDILWFCIFVTDGYAAWTEMLWKIAAVPLVLVVLAVAFDIFISKRRMLLNDYIMLMILNTVVLLVMADDQWTHSLQVICILPVIFGMILGRLEIIYVQVVISAVMVVIHFIYVEMCSGPPWKDHILLNFSGMMFNVIVVARIIIQIRKYTQMLDTQTTIDSLTRLHNHEAFYEELNRKMAEYRQTKEPLSILIADIDNFKKVNDTYGHAYGDKVLKVLADIFAEESSTRCFVARYGGEEFAMIMDMNQDDAVTKAQRIRRRFEQQQIPIDADTAKSFTVSVGVACCCSDYMTSSQFFEKADEALYKAKASGKNRVCL